MLKPLSTQLHPVNVYYTHQLLSLASQTNVSGVADIQIASAMQGTCPNCTHDPHHNGTRCKVSCSNRSHSNVGKITPAIQFAAAEPVFDESKGSNTTNTELKQMGSDTSDAMNKLPNAGSHVQNSIKTYHAAMCACCSTLGWLTAALMLRPLLHISLYTKRGRGLQTVAQAQLNGDLTQRLCVKVMMYVRFDPCHQSHWRLSLHYG